MAENAIPRITEKISELNIDPTTLLLVDRTVAAQNNIIPIKFHDEDGTLDLVTWKESNFLDTNLLLRIIKDQAGKVNKINLFLAEFDNMQDGFKTYYNQSINNTSHAQDANPALDSEITTKATKFVREIMEEARKMGARDIHVTPTKNSAIVQYRINGSLYKPNQPVLPEIKQQIINRIKVLAEMDTTNSFVPDDGSMNFGDIDFRINTYPCGDYGEKINIRLMDSHSNLRALDDIKFPAADLLMLKKLVRSPYGIILMTGPTGQGKSTTLYACLRERGTEENVVLSVEDPVEQRIEGAAQAEIRLAPDNDKVSLTFSKALRATLRQDPDIILVGEIRDAETAITAVQASQTGHLVFATLHTRNAINSIQRMVDIGIDRNSFLSEMVAIISQRLVPLNCPDCCKKVVSDYNNLLREKDLARLEDNKYTYASTGCEKCNYTGIVSRIPITEIIPFDNILRDYFVERRGLVETEKFLRQHDFRSLWDKGLDLVIDQKVSLDNLCDVLMVDEDYKD